MLSRTTETTPPADALRGQVPCEPVSRHDGPIAYRGCDALFCQPVGRVRRCPVSLALYGAANALAILFLLILTYDVRRYELLDPRAGVDDVSHWRESLATLGVFLLCIPGAYVLKSHGPWILVLLAVPVRLPGFLHRFQAFLRRRRSAKNPTV